MDTNLNHILTGTISRLNVTPIEGRLTYFCPQTQGRLHIPRFLSQTDVVIDLDPEFGGKYILKFSGETAL